MKMKVNEKKIIRDEDKLLAKWKMVIEYLEERGREPELVLEILSKLDGLHELLERRGNNEMEPVADAVELFTVSKGKSFKYKGSVEEGTMIYFGHNNYEFIDRELYKELLHTFSGKRVLIGEPTLKNPTAESMGTWLKSKVKARAMYSYIAPVLIKEEYAFLPDDETRNEIQFRRFGGGKK
ncbi:hypothetical protein V1499_18525 [Neobacillus sp. SCS-31]|uniref:hypothetical protein n=1 Tax=Neobacillus oceani TaxID=3115292 RepID=UPI003905EB89